MKRNLKKVIEYSLICIVSLIACGILGYIAPSMTVNATEIIDGKESIQNYDELEIVSCNLSFRDNICIKYAVNTDSTDTTLLIWDSPQSDYTKGSETFELRTVGKQLIENEYYLIYDYNNISAKQMTDDIYARAYNNGEYGNLVKYSVLQYAYNILGKTKAKTTNQDLENLMNDMLVYGASAQKYFNYKTDRLATDEFYQMKLVDATFEDGTDYGLFLSGNVNVKASSHNTNGTPFYCWLDQDGNELSKETEYTYNLSKNTTLYTIYECLDFKLHYDGTSYIVKGIGDVSDTNIIIPATYNGLPVTEIEPYAFAGCTSLTSVSLSSSLKTIGHNAFTGCSSLTSVSLPSSLRTIEEAAFVDCISLTSISIPSRVDKICESTFQGCTSLASVSLSSMLRGIESYAFAYCTSLTSVYIPSNVNRINNKAFIYCDEDLTIYCQAESKPDNWDIDWNVIDTETWRRFNNIIWDYDINHLTHILEHIAPVVSTDCHYGNFEYWHCLHCGRYFSDEACENRITLQDTISPAAHQFENGICSSCGMVKGMEKLDYRIGIDNDSYTVHGIGECELENLVIPSMNNGLPVKKIVSQAFKDCNNLSSVYIPSSVEYVFEGIFYGCNKNLIIYCEAESLPANWDSNFNVINAEKSRFDVLWGYDINHVHNLEHIEAVSNLCQEGNIEYWHCSDCNLYFSNESCNNRIIEEEIYLSALPHDFENGKCINCGMVEGMEKLSYRLSEDKTYYIVNGIGECELTNLYIPSKYNGLPVKEIAEFAFKKCKSIVSIYIPSTITKVDDEVFVDCDPNLIINCEAESKPIHWGLYWNVIDTVTWTCFTNTIWGYDINHVHNLEHIEAVSNLCQEGNIEYWHCSDCDSYYSDETCLHPITFVDTVLHTTHNFENGICTNCELVSLEEMEKLEFTLSEDETYYIVSGIGEYRPMKIIILESYEELPVAEIGDEAFAGLEITSIYIPSSIKKIGNGVFIDCTLLNNVFISTGVTEIGYGAFGRCTSLKSINIPSSVENMGYNIFNSCNKNMIIYCEAQSKPSNWSLGWCHYDFSGSKLLKVFWGCDINHTHEAEHIEAVSNVCQIGNIEYWRCLDCDRCFLDSSCKNEVFNFDCILPAIHHFENGICSNCKTIENDMEEGMEKLTYCLSNDKTYYLVSGIAECELEKLVIPSIYNGLPVKEIADSAFSYCRSLTSVYIPSSVQIIGEYAFLNCTSLKSVQISSGVTTISIHAFSRCISLTSIYIPSSVRNIKQFAFLDCGNNDFTIYLEVEQEQGLFSPYSLEYDWNSITNERDKATVVWGCEPHVHYLKHVDEVSNVCHDGNKEYWYCLACDKYFLDEACKKEAFASDFLLSAIHDYVNGVCSKCGAIEAFDKLDYCFSEDGTYYIITNILDNTFTDLVIPAYYNGLPIKKIDYRALEYGTFTSIVIPFTVIEIGESAFADCDNLTSINILGEITKINATTFAGCTSLEEITIPSSVTEIDGLAFIDCNGLNYIYIPSSVTIINDYAFMGCKETMTIYCEGESQPVTWEDDWNVVNDSYGRCKVVWLYHTHEIEHVLANSNVCHDGNTEYWHCLTCNKYFTESSCENETTWLEILCPAIHNYVEGVCSDCGASDALDKLDYSLSDDGNYYIVNGIGQCDLIDLVIPSTYQGLPVKKIGMQAFVNCTELTSIEIPIGVVEIGYAAFSGCTSLQNVTFFSNLTTICAFAFKNCTALTEIYIPSSVTKISDYAFLGCNKLLTIYCQAESLKPTWEIDWDVFSLDTWERYNVIYLDHTHELEYIEAVSNVCKQGNIEHWHCLTCDKYFAEESCTRSINKEETILSPAPHNFENGICSNCGIVEGMEKLTYRLQFDGGYPYYVVSGMGECTLTDLVIPAYYNGYPVEYIGSGFKNTETLNSIKLPSTVMYIGNHAFDGCTSLTSIEMSPNIRYIGEYAFNGCTSLTELEIPFSTLYIGTFAFRSCSSLTNILIPYSVAFVGSSAFIYCNNDMIINCEVNAQPSKWDSNWNVADMINGTRFNAVWDCCIHDLEHIVQTAASACHDGYIEHWHCLKCDKYFIDANCQNQTTSLATILPAIHNFENGVCSDCQIVEGMEKLDYRLSKDKTYYVIYGIGNCQLTELVIPTTYNGLPVKEIRYIAFFNCSSLTSVYIPSSIELVHVYAFYGCPDNMIIYCENESQPNDWHIDWNIISEDDWSRFDVIWGYDINLVHN